MRLENILLHTKMLSHSMQSQGSKCVCERDFLGGCMNVVIISPRLLKFGDMVSLAGRASAESLAEIRMD